MKLSKNIVEGQIVQFGKYYQSDSSCLEPIDWLVLDNTNTSVLLLSRFALDSVNYSYEKFASAINWEISYLRKWLNSDFFNIAFSDDERDSVIMSKIKYEDNPQTYLGSFSGNDTDDKVFLLSIQEVEHYLPEDSQRVCVATDYTLLKKKCYY